MVRFLFQQQVVEHADQVSVAGQSLSGGHDQRRIQLPWWWTRQRRDERCDREPVGASTWRAIESPIDTVDPHQCRIEDPNAATLATSVYGGSRRCGAPYGTG
ncbi:hypothetical protein R3Q06_32385 [Rhodococcus erythropolis]|uniref:hypothetical protein n=1 Tax=Rhodococcus erythropolis TaxID=1833 RepID=UPI002949A75F|nr:hypothetical protein [Rhodococcus erythropolis]MDV6278168.1 hypothetical protein [Rhodococcus erythropolis]